MRKPVEFHRDLAELRDRFGEKEYNRNDILPDVEALLETHGITQPALLRDAANAALDAAEAAEDKIDPDQPFLFPHNAQAALGERNRIKRGRFGVEHCFRRKRIIDRNKKAQDRAWAREDDWIAETQAALAGRPAGTVREDILNEDGTPKAPAPASTGTPAHV